MARQPTSMLGHMYAATQRAVRVMAAPVAFVGRAAMQAAERLIPQGANELGQAIYTGNAYAPPGLTERVVKPEPPTVAPIEDYSTRLSQAASRVPQARDNAMER